MIHNEEKEKKVKADTLKELQYFKDAGIRVKILELLTTLMDVSHIYFLNTVDENKRMIAGELAIFMSYERNALGFS